MEENLNQKRKVGINNRIIWILIVAYLWGIIIPDIIATVLFSTGLPYYDALASIFPEQGDGLKFTIYYYLSTLPCFIAFLAYTRVTKRNLFVFDTFWKGTRGYQWSWLCKGLLAGFILNFGCIALALLHGDIKLMLNFAAVEIPFYLFALVCVFIQSSSEEMWTRGFIYDRVNVHYPLWVAILVNGLFFGALHIFNDGAGVLPILDICICGLSYSIAKWYSGTIWFPMGIHTAWNFTQNFLFGLPNSGLVSEVSVFSLDASNARTTWLYDYVFGVEGAIPAVFADLILGLVCLYLLKKQGRLGELTQKLE